MTDYVTSNRASWDERAPTHAASEFYGLDRFTADPDFVSEVVAFDKSRLGDIRGLRGLHLQCHIGTDTVSLARLGATMSGLDFSPAALAEARKLATASGVDIDFREALVDDAVDVFGAASFDLVYTGIGALCWLPSMANWAGVVAGLLRPGGRLFVREGHPVLWALDEEADGLVLGYPYFETAGPLTYEYAGTYTNREAEFTNRKWQSWNHGIGEIITALLDAGLRLTAFVEHDSVPWTPLPGRMTKDDAGEWRLTEHPERMPMTYTLQAVKE